MAGCVETVVAHQGQPEAQIHPRTNMAPREGVSPHGASVAVTDIEGVPASLSGDLSSAFAKQASAREINLTDPKTANYLVRGYLNSAPAEGGAAFSVVWDVYDANKRRTQRIDDVIFVKEGAPDRFDQAVLNQIAAQSADDLAAVLSNMPEAIAAASSTSAKTVSVAEASGVTRIPASPVAASPAPQVQGIGMASSSR